MSVQIRGGAEGPATSNQQQRLDQLFPTTLAYLELLFGFWPFVLQAFNLLSGPKDSSLREIFRCSV